MRCNEAINAILKNGVEASSKYGSQGRGVFGNAGSALLSPLEFATRAVNEGDITKAMIDTFGKDNEFMLGKAVGGVVGGITGLRAGMGVMRGTFTDGQGNFDAPGIPLI